MYQQKAFTPKEEERKKIVEHKKAETHKNKTKNKKTVKTTSEMKLKKDLQKWKNWQDLVRKRETLALWVEENYKEKTFRQDGEMFEAKREEKSGRENWEERKCRMRGMQKKE